MAKIKMVVETGFSGADHEDEIEVDKSEWDAMSEAQRETFLDEVAKEYLFECVSASAWVVEEDSE